MNTFGQYLIKRYHEWSGKNLLDGIRSQNDFAKWLGVAPTNLSVWMNDVRKPVGENVDKLADKLGPEVYDILDMPRRMPKNRKLNFIATVWNQLPEDMQDEWYERARNQVEPKEDTRKNSFA